VVTRAPSHLALAAIAIASAATGCTKKYAEIEVRDPRRVGVSTMGAQGVEELLPPDGTDRATPFPNAPAVAARHGRDVVVRFQGEAPLALVDDRNALPHTQPGPGIEIRGRTLQVNYNVTKSRIFPGAIVRDESLPLMLTSDLSNVVDAREVREVRHWPAYVCLPLGVLLGVSATGLLSSNGTGDKVGGGVLIAGAVPLIVYSIVNLTSSTDYKPLEIPGAPPR
jgi:hypothetical protein